MPPQTHRLRTGTEKETSGEKRFGDEGAYRQN